MLILRGDMRTKSCFFIAATLIALALAARAQNRGSIYGTQTTWWDAGMGLLFTWEEDYENPDGQVRVVNRNGPVHTKGHAFFEALGTNQRACITCHQPASAMSISAAAIRDRWEATHGTDPIFAAVDGANCPDQDPAARNSHSLLLNRGLFRIALPSPGNADFRIEVIADPTGCNRNANEISVYRRPRVAANLTSLVTGPEGVALMADGREPSLRAQAITAARVHEQASAAPTSDQLTQILDFETQIATAQISHLRGGMLNDKDGPALLSPDHTVALDPQNPAWLSFAVWDKPAGGVQVDFRASVARGSRIFANRKFEMQGTTRTCASCHTAGTTRWMDIGTGTREAADLPTFKVTCTNGRITLTHDPGRALISGKCEDVGAIVIPQFRGLAARAPYFSNGTAPTLRDVVDHYDTHFTEQEKRDLVNFLKVL
jgi:hypothetical protein